MGIGSTDDDDNHHLNQEHQQQHHHIVLVPFLAQGHIIPFLAFADHLDQRYNHMSTTITLVSTPLNARNFRSSLPPNTRVHVRDLPFHAPDHGLPPGAENTSSVPYNFIVRLMDASLSLEPAFDRLISDILHQEEGRRPVVTIIGDVFFGWTARVARRHGAFHSTFTTCGAYGTAAYMSLWLHLPHADKGDDEEVGVPGFPDTFRLQRSQLSESLKGSVSTNEWKDFLQSQIKLALSSDGLLCNSAEELEPAGMDILRKFTNLPVWAIGPLLLDEKKCASRQRAGKKTGVSLEACMEWLDSHSPASVVYISFGSQNTISAGQMMALAAGLETSGTAFLWVIRPPIGFDLRGEFRDEWLPPGFEKRVVSSGQGLLVRDWASQTEILSHEAVGGFLSHCGWNSTLESLTRGVPMIGWPMAADQFYNSKIMEEELGVCLEMTRGVVENIAAEEVVRVVRSVMGGEKGVEMRRRAGEVAEKMKGAMSEDEGKEKGSSLCAMDEFMVLAALPQQRNADQFNDGI